MKTNPAPDRLEVTRDGQKTELFMSHALLNRLAVKVGGLDGLAHLHHTPEMQEAVLLEVFTKRKGKEIIEQPEMLEEIDVPISDISNVLDWVTRNITDFFLTAAEKGMASAQSQEARLSVLQATLTGSSISRLNTSAA